MCHVVPTKYVERYVSLIEPTDYVKIGVKNYTDSMIIQLYFPIFLLLKPMATAKTPKE